MEQISLTKEEVKNYLLSRSLLYSKVSTIGEVLDYLGCIQVDPINVVARSHELALYNRVNNFSLQNLYSELYEKRSFFEYWMQLFSIIPILAFPYMSLRMKSKEKWSLQYYKEHKSQIEAVKDYITEHGPTAAENLAHIKAGKNLFSWTNTSSKTALLEYLWDGGEIMIHHREKNRKYYDLTERILPSDQQRDVPLKEAQLFLIYRNFDYIGLTRKAFLNRVGYAKNLGLTQIFDEEVEKGNIVMVKVDGIKTRYYVSKLHLGQIESGIKNKSFEGIHILSPLDPFIIDRQHLTDFFDFHYRWEAYTPSRLRQYGFYNMPILFNGSFIGQIDLKRSSVGKLDTKLLSLLRPNEKHRVIVLKEAENIEKCFTISAI